jgi:hypothetical protein
VGAATWFLHWSSQPAETTVHIADTQTAARTPKPAYQPFKSKLFRSEVPYGWVIRFNTDTASLTQATSFPDGASLERGQIGMTADSLPPSGLSGVPDYNLRVQDPRTYVRQPSTLPGVSALFLDTNTASAYTAFLVNGSRYASITVSQFATPGDAFYMLVHLLDSWKWTV